MGYYSKFEIKVTETDGTEIKHMGNNGGKLDRLLKAATKDQNVNWSFMESLEDGDTKWYDMCPDMRAISREFPEYIFIVDRRGEEWPDLSRHYFHNGAEVSEAPKIVYKDADQQTARVLTQGARDCAIVI